MRSFLGLMVALLSVAVCHADRPIFLVTPSGVYQSVVDSSGKPGAWVPIAADVIVQGFPNQPPEKPIPPTPPTPSDPVVQQVAEVSKKVLKDSNDATAMAAIVDSLAKLNLSETDFRQSLEMAAPVADASLSAGGRLTEWSKQSLAITGDPAKLKAGLMLAFNVTQGTLDTIREAAVNPSPETTAKAVNWELLINIIQTILTLLKNLGIGGLN